MDATPPMITLTSSRALSSHTRRENLSLRYVLEGGLSLEKINGASVDVDHQVYPPGSVNHLHRGEVIQYSMPSKCFALEYARGWIPPMLFFGYADTFSSTLDFPTLWATTRITGREMITNLLKWKL